VRRWQWLLVVYVALAGVAAVQQWSLQRPGDPYTHYNNYVIYRQSFFHLIGSEDLYVLRLTEHWDYFRYSPSFALAFGVFAWLPDLAGLLLWDLLNATILFLAWATLPLRDDRIALAAGWFVTVEMMTALQNAQSNVLIAGLLVLAFNLLERRRLVPATLAIAVAAFTKPFGLAAFGLGLLYPDRSRFVLWSIVWCVAIAVLPMPVVGPAQLARLYQSWGHLLVNDYTATGLSFMAWLQTWFHVAPSNLAVLIPAAALLASPIVFVHRAGELGFRLLVLCDLLIWVVIFNHKAESSSYIIALCGAALWFFSVERTWPNTILMVAAFVFTTLSPTDVFPRRWSDTVFVPYAIKAVPCIFIWAKITADLLLRRYRPKAAVALQDGVRMA